MSRTMSNERTEYTCTKYRYERVGLSPKEVTLLATKGEYVAPAGSRVVNFCHGDDTGIWVFVYLEWPVESA